MPSSRLLYPSYIVATLSLSGNTVQTDIYANQKGLYIRVPGDTVSPEMETYYKDAVVLINV